jgi:hypothetical protein
MVFALNDADLDRVCGGLQAGYVFCPNGPAGTGVYADPEGDGCPTPPTNGEVYAAFFEGVRKGMGK